ncbi:MAG TPA: hypothetical protein VER79_03130 [Candidatus Limnocylindrales bacterium]|nr:hypothetical protein [Candidatus Limnocylindrales bacterium]
MGRIIVSNMHVFDEERNVLVYADNAEIGYGNINIKIEVYRARVLGWFLDVAKGIVADGRAPGDYVAVMVALSYIEGLEQFREGKETPRSSSASWFRRSASRIFPEQSEEVLQRIWKETRCGLFHAGFPSGKIYLSHDRRSAIEVDGDRIYINPNEFVDRVVCHFLYYIDELQNERNADLRKHFEQLWDLLWTKT